MPWSIIESATSRKPDVNTVATYVIQNKLAGVHFWSYDRDVDCPPGSVGVPW